MVASAKIQRRVILWRNSDLPINVFLFCCFFWTFGVCPSALLWILCWLQKSLKIVRNAIKRQSIGFIFLKSQFSARGNTIFCEEKSSVCQFWASKKLQYSQHNGLVRFPENSRDWAETGFSTLLNTFASPQTHEDDAGSNHMHIDIALFWVGSVFYEVYQSHVFVRLEFLWWPSL